MEKIRGGHYILDFFGCDVEQLNSMDFWKKILPESAKAAEMEILQSNFHQFQPYGITGFLLLSTSHISFHTWPEHEHVACDVFSCSSDEYTKKAVEYLKEKVKHTSCDIKFVDRGFVM